MLTHPTQQEQEAILRIALSPDGQKFMEFLRRSLKDRDKEIRFAEGAYIGRCQGRSIQLSELIEILDKS